MSQVFFNKVMLMAFDEDSGGWYMQWLHKCIGAEVQKCRNAQPSGRMFCLTLAVHENWQHIGRRPPVRRRSSHDKLGWVPQVLQAA